MVRTTWLGFALPEDSADRPAPAACRCVPSCHEKPCFTSGTRHATGLRIRDSADFTAAGRCSRTSARRSASPWLQRSTTPPVVQEAIEKADLLIEAMGWIRQFRDKITVIKLGGSV